MRFDFIDMIVNTGDEYLTGMYYRRRPTSPLDGAVTFRYKQLDPNSKVFDKLLGELRKDASNYSITTNDDCKFIIGGYIRTQNGLLWEITSIISNEEVKGGNEALRWFKVAKNSEVSIRMVQVDDLWDVEPVYVSKCKIRFHSAKLINTVFYSWGLGPITEEINAYEWVKEVEAGSAWSGTFTFEDGETVKVSVSKKETMVRELNRSI